MKTIITAKAADIMSEFDLRFGRGAFFCIYDSETGKTDFLKNEFAEAQGGAGTKTAEKMVELGISKVVSGDFGPKAKSLLNEFNIEMQIYQDDSKTIKEIIELI
jgi:predicted Fe-Mo cluster-binding NifX family protein